MLWSLAGPAAAESPAQAAPAAKAKPQAKSLSQINKGPLGYWKHIDDDTGKTDSIFKIWLHEGELRGRIEKRFPIAGKEMLKVCSECEGKLKDRPIDGLLFLWGFEFDKEDKKWVEGKVLNPEDGNVYNSEITLTDNGKVLEVYGYIQLLVKIGGTSKWTRPTTKELEGVL